MCPVHCILYSPFTGEASMRRTLTPQRRSLNTLPPTCDQVNLGTSCLQDRVGTCWVGAPAAACASCCLAPVWHCLAPLPLPRCLLAWRRRGPAPSHCLRRRALHLSTAPHCPDLPLPPALVLVLPRLHPAKKPAFCESTCLSWLCMQRLLRIPAPCLRFTHTACLWPRR